MIQSERYEAIARLRRRLWFLRERLEDVPQDQRLTSTTRQEKIGYYTFAIAEARQKLVELEGH